MDNEASLIHFSVKLNEGREQHTTMLADYKNDDWKRYIEFGEETYKKVILFENDIYQLALLCWKKGQETDIHSHPLYTSCTYKILEGEFKEYRYDNEGKVNREFNHIEGDVFFVANMKINHKMLNVSENSSFTLHIYKK